MTVDADRAAISDLITRLYAAISGPAGPRDWAAHRAAYHEAGRQMRTGVDAKGASWIKIMDVDAYRKDAQARFDETDFHEMEISNRIDILGNMAQAWSLYEARTAPDDATPERRGVNSIQFFKTPSGEWKIVSMIWDNERPGVSVAPF